MRVNDSGEVVCLLFLRALPDEYNVFRQMLEREREKRTIDRLRTELLARYDLLYGEKSWKPSNTSILAHGLKRGISRGRHGKCGNVSRNKKKDERGLWGETVMVRTVAMVRMLATELHPGNKVDPHAATSARRRDTSGSSTSSESVVSASRLATIPIPALRL